jgi:hypothetical protein
MRANRSGRWLYVLLAAGGCSASVDRDGDAQAQLRRHGGSVQPAPPDLGAAPDLMPSADPTSAPDLAPAPDLASPPAPDLASPPDLAAAPAPDLAHAPDLAGAPAPGSGPSHTGLYVIDGTSGLVLDGDSFTSANDVCLRISNSSNVTVRNASFIHCYGVGIDIESSTNITVQSSYFEDLNGGVYALSSSGIRITGSRFKNVSRAGKQSPDRGQFVQFDKVTGGGSAVSFNTGVNGPTADPEDLISMYETYGTAASPVIIEGNCLSGGGPSASGGGIMTGDFGGGYIVARNNTLVNPGQYGMAISGGSNIQLLDNRIYAVQGPVNNVGLYVWAQGGAACSGNTVQGNQVDYTNATGARNNAWDGGNCGVIAGWASNDFAANLTGLTCPF